MLLHIDHLLCIACRPRLSGGQQQRLAIARAPGQARLRCCCSTNHWSILTTSCAEPPRAELPRTCSPASRTTVVYATTEPLEALIMGGEVGRLCRRGSRPCSRGPPCRSYHQPGSLRVYVLPLYSDPPMNTLAVTVERTGSLPGGPQRVRPADDRPLSGGCGGWACNMLGVRANHLSIGRQSASATSPSRPRSKLSEISGSETFIHVRNGDLHWVVQQEGVHEHAPCTTIGGGVRRTGAPLMHFGCGRRPGKPRSVRAMRAGAS